MERCYEAYGKGAVGPEFYYGARDEGCMPGARVWGRGGGKGRGGAGCWLGPGAAGGRGRRAEGCERGLRGSVGAAREEWEGGEESWRWPRHGEGRAESGEKKRAQGRLAPRSCSRWDKELVLVVVVDLRLLDLMRIPALRRIGFDLNQNPHCVSRITTVSDQKRVSDFWWYIYLLILYSKIQVLFSGSVIRDNMHYSNRSSFSLRYISSYFFYIVLLGCRLATAAFARSLERSLLG